jgi:hypothetical protein
MCIRDSVGSEMCIRDRTMAEATTMFEVFDKIVAKMDADAAKIAELEAELLDRRTVELGGLMSDISEDHWAAGWLW